MNKKLFLFSISCFLYVCMNAAPYADIVVAADGSGKYKTITEAVNALPYFNYERIVIFIKKGIYNEKIRIDQDNITLIGENKDSTIIQFSQLRSDWDSAKDFIGPAVININGDDIVLKNLTIQNTQPQTGPHAFALYGTGTRTVIVNCNVLSNGGDTVSLWNYKEGLYYHSECYFKGAVDFVCPRGWCYISNSQFYEVEKTAALWHAGTLNKDQKFVLKNCSFDGVEGFNLARHHYEAQFYLINCKFSKSMADAPIFLKLDKKNPEKNRPYFWGNRYYFHNCHRENGDYAWFSNNMKNPEQVTASWTFDKKWNPESTEPAHVTNYSINNDTVILYFNEFLTIRGVPQLKTKNNAILTYTMGRGRNMLQFTSDKKISGEELQKGLELFNGEIISTEATINERSLLKMIVYTPK